MSKNRTHTQEAKFQKEGIRNGRIPMDTLLIRKKDKKSKSIKMQNSIFFFLSLMTYETERKT